jgi:hypothetical protein
MKTRLEELREQVAKFHAKHPEVWDLFVRFSMEMINRGYQTYSAQSVIERIRWEKDIGGNGSTSFKINNNYSAFYSRRFMKMYPQYEGFFRTRQQVSSWSDATELPELTPQDYEYTNDRYLA